MGLCVLVNLNAWIGDRVRVNITGVFGFPGGNDNGRRGVTFCSERRLCVCNTHLKYKSLHRYTKVARDQDGMEVQSMIELVLVKKDMLRYGQEVRAVRRMGRGLLDHSLVICKVSFMGA